MCFIISFSRGHVSSSYMQVLVAINTRNVFPQIRTLSMLYWMITRAVLGRFHLLRRFSIYTYYLYRTLLGFLSHNYTISYMRQAICIVRVIRQISDEFIKTNRRRNSIYFNGFAASRADFLQCIKIIPWLLG